MLIVLLFRIPSHDIVYSRVICNSYYFFVHLRRGNMLTIGKSSKSATDIPEFGKDVPIRSSAPWQTPFDLLPEISLIHPLLFSSKDFLHHSVFLDSRKKRLAC